MHGGLPVTDAFPLPRDHGPQLSDFSSEVVKVRAHVVRTDGLDWRCTHSLPPVRQTLTAQVETRCLFLHKSARPRGSYLRCPHAHIQHRAYSQSSGLVRGISEGFYSAAAADHDAGLPIAIRLAITMDKPKVLTSRELRTIMPRLTGWKLAQNKLSRTFEFTDFVHSLSFINSLVAYFETMDHHPDVHIAYGEVTFELTRYDVGGKVTDRDVEVAKKISSVYRAHS